MSIDWNKLEDQFNSFKPQAPEGTYKVKVEKVEVKQLPSGSIPVTFTFANSKDHSFPWCTHWVSIGNVGWTQWHHKQLLQVLGVNEDNAKKAIENAYDKCTSGSTMPAALITALQNIYDKIAAKKPEVEIVVRPQVDQNGEFRYSQKGYQQFESEFTDPRVFSAQQTKQQTKQEDVEQEAEEDLGIEDDEMPF